MVSSMETGQYHDKSFWQRSDDQNGNYDVKKKPVTKSSILTVHGTEDKVVPYAGGKRGRNAVHLSAQDTAFYWAQQKGFRGEKITDEKGKEITDFVLNKNPFNNSKILIAGKNFGCGSSREHAPWALLDFGITCVISSSFADIFYSNCFKNGILPIILDEEKIKELSEYAKRKEEIFVDLNEEKIIFGNSETKFKVDSFKKKCLLEGLDDIALSLKKSEKIKTFEEDLKNKKPWIFND